jgi:hypothetical protein
VVKIIFAILFLSSLSFADAARDSSLLIQKIKTFINSKTYEQNRAYIDILFSPKSDYFVNGNVDAVKVIQTLKENGLLNLFFAKPSELTLRFKTSGSPLFFVKIMGDTLRSIGYYRYVTQESNLNNSEFTWTINLTSEYATDPLILQQELKKSGSRIIDIRRDSATDWTYVVDMRDGRLNVESLQEGIGLSLKRSLYSKWIDVSQVKKIKISSSRRNSWYPYIAYYDASLHLLKVEKHDSKSASLTLELNENTHYIKISDIYSLKNIRDDLTLMPIGVR